MFHGFKKLKQCTGGDFVRFASGGYALVTDYSSRDTGDRDAYALDGGDAIGSHMRDEWVMVIDTDYLDVLFEIDGIEYPENTNGKATD